MAKSSKTIEAMKAEREGKLICICCDAILKGKQRVLCADKECWKLYIRLYLADRREKPRPTTCKYCNATLPKQNETGTLYTTCPDCKLVLNRKRVARWKAKRKAKQDERTRQGGGAL